MTTNVRTFKAESLEAALEIVHRELGQDAIILHTRHVEQRRIWPWSRRRQEVELTAGVGASVSSRTNGAAASRSGPGPQAPALADAADLAPPPSLLETKLHRRHNVEPPKWSPNDVIPDDAPQPTRKSAPGTGPSRSGTGRHTPAPSNSAPTPLHRLAGTQAQTIAARARQTASPNLGKVSGTLGNVPDTGAAIHERLDQLQRMILELGRERSRTTLHDVPTELFQLFTTLLDADVEDELARELVCRAKQHATPSQLRQPQAMWPVLVGLVERELKIAGPIQPTRGCRKVVALVGPTGVGKTTTLAKLAANFHLRDGVKVGLITVDTYRIAAVEQLRTYAELIQLPMRVVTTPDEMHRALDELVGLDLVLIDTAGRSPQDDVKIHELKQFLDAAHADEVHLVLSLTSSPKTLATVAVNFQPVGVTSLIFTKLDEAPGLGGLFQLVRQAKTPISYLTTGQDVPDDIEPAHATRLARLILGQDPVTGSLPVPSPPSSGERARVRGPSAPKTPSP